MPALAGRGDGSPSHTVLALDPDEGSAVGAASCTSPPLRAGVSLELALAADNFTASPPARRRCCTRSPKVQPSLPAHSFDWGRDTMSSRLRSPRRAGWILRTFAHYVRDGLIPNLFLRGRNQACCTGRKSMRCIAIWRADERYRDVEIMLRSCHGSRSCRHSGLSRGRLLVGSGGLSLTWINAKVDDLGVGEAMGVEHSLVQRAMRWASSAMTTRSKISRQNGASFGSSAFLVRSGRLSLRRGRWRRMGGASAKSEYAISSATVVDPQPMGNSDVAGVEKRLLTPMGLRSIGAQD